MDGFYKLKPRGYYNHHTRKERDSVYDLDPYIANGEFIRIGDDVYRVRKQRRSSNDLYSLPVR